MIDGFYHALESIGPLRRIHLVFACVPVGLITGAVFFSLGAYVWKKANLRVSGAHAVVLAFIFVFPSVLFGVFDWMHFYDAHLSSAIKMKMALSLALIVLLAVAIILQGEEKVKPVFRLTVYILSLGVTVGLGYFGSRLLPGGNGEAAPPAAASAPGPGSGGALSAGGSVQGMPTASAEDIQAGEVIFASNCQGCHPGGSNVVIPAFPLKSAEQLESFQTFQRFIHDPRLPDGSKGPMPAFPPEKLSEAQDRKLYAYIRSMLDNGAWQ